MLLSKLLLHLLHRVMRIKITEEVILALKIVLRLITLMKWIWKKRAGLTDRQISQLLMDYIFNMPKCDIMISF